MLSQIEKLYHGILTACIASRSSKANLRMLLDVDDLQSYLQYAFNHYSGTLSSPFDFVQASFMNSPIPPDFGGNILKLAINMMDHLGERIQAKPIFAELSFIVASCIMFDSARNNIRGKISLTFYLDVYAHLLQVLLSRCSQNILSISTRHWKIFAINTGRVNFEKGTNDVSTLGPATAPKDIKQKMDVSSQMENTNQASNSAKRKKHSAKTSSITCGNY
jgi:hypothetical protein